MYEKVWNHNKMAYGGDYNPEQWDESVWAEDMRLFKLAHIDTVTLNVFSWASLQPSEDVYDFSKLDKIMNMVRENGLKVVLATSTAHHPAWMVKKYPEILRTEFNGMRRKFGGRHNSCPNSEVYRKFAVRLADKLADRYKDYDNIIAWHISNEYGGECYCDLCEKAFQGWLKDKYQTIDELNRVWNTSFWGHTFYEWDEVVAPNMLSEHFGYEQSMFQGISIDYKRFYSDSMLDCYRIEYDAVKKHTPDIPVTTNFMEFYKILDYQKWSEYMDFISWDSYPSVDASAGKMALNHELMRGLKQGKPFILMEQTPSVTNWQPYNELKRPGVMRLWSYQAVAHGSDSVMFFQMRRSIGACEKYHSAVIDHAGHENTRVFREIAALGAELDIIGDKTLGTREKAECAIIFDWDNWWGIEYSAGPSRLMRYRDEVERYYEAFFAHNIPVDIISVKDDFSKYKVICAPILYMVKEGVDEKIRSFVNGGGKFVTTFFSGYVDEHDLVTIGGYPGKLRDIMGIWVEEIDALPEGKKNSFVWEGTTYNSELLCDLLHSEGAEVLATYEEDFYAGMPVLTKNSFGKGHAYYVATRSDAAFYKKLVGDICEDVGITGVMNTPDGVEATARYNEDKKFVFLLNHAGETREVTADDNYVDLINGHKITVGEKIILEKTDVKILEKA
ncbi:MAG: beta-galactosidase [Lachnospiraceae bacterium]|nr:beta-galactosidase [Lachnospiraceae bacterium]